MRIQLQLPRAHYGLEVGLELPESGTTVLFGASGSGKTSLLRCVAGLERGQGVVRVAGETWQDDAARVFVPPHRRALGYVFQEASLFEHLDVAGNLRYGVRRSKAPQAREQLEAAIDLLGIRHLEARRTDGLSGGERQRVAIARALATGPKLLLLDEPLAALDAARRREVLPWIEKLRAELRIPMLYVTHSADELARLADHVVVLDAGRVRASGAVHEVLASLDNPAFAGEDAGVLLQGQVEARSAEWHLARIAFDGGALWVRDGGAEVGAAVRVRVLARDVSVALAEPVATSIQNQLPCTVDAIAPDVHPSQVLVRLRCGEALLLARITRRAAVSLQLAPGMHAWAQVKSAALVQ